LTVRGDYTITLGPDIRDVSGNLMNQDNDGTNGEAIQDQFNANLRLILADVIFTTATAVSETNTAFNNKNILIDGTTVAIDGPHQFTSVHIVNGGVLTHSASAATQTNTLGVSIADQLLVDASSRIDVTGKGYLAGRTSGNSTVGASTGRSGGSYGGMGFFEEGTPNAVYGDYADPDEPGSGTGVGRSPAPGGGLVRITAKTMQLDGQVLADGGRTGSGNDGPGGSGGGIYIAVTTLQGSGLIRARGGAGGLNPAGGFGGAGGGGRVAVCAQDYQAFGLTKITAPGGAGPGNGPHYAAPGTVYLRDTDTTFGTLIYDAASPGVATATLGLPSVSSFSIPDAVVIRGAQTRVQPEHSGLQIEFVNGLTIEDSAQLTIDASAIHRLSPIVRTNATLTINGPWTISSPVSITDATLNVRGDWTVNVLNPTSGAQIVVDGVITSGVSQTFSKGSLTADRVVMPNLALINGAVMTRLAAPRRLRKCGSWRLKYRKLCQLMRQDSVPSRYG
jgi:hypothetical protein